MVAPPIVVVAIPAHRMMEAPPFAGITIKMAVMVAIIVVALSDGDTRAIRTDNEAEARLSVGRAHRSAYQSQRDDRALEQRFHGSLLLSIRQGRMGVAQASLALGCAACSPQKNNGNGKLLFHEKTARNVSPRAVFRDRFSGTNHGDVRGPNGRDSRSKRVVRNSKAAHSTHTRAPVCSSSKADTDKARNRYCNTRHRPGLYRTRIRTRPEHWPALQLPSRVKPKPARQVPLLRSFS